MAKSSSPKSPMTKDAARRVQSAEARKNGGQVSKDSFAAIATSLADKAAASPSSATKPK